MTSDLKYWKDGQPVVMDSGHGTLQFWLDGQPFVFYLEAASESNVASVSTVERDSIASVASVAKANIAAICSVEV
jgi:hypothetical protein